MNKKDLSVEFYKALVKLDFNNATLLVNNVRFELTNVYFGVRDKYIEISTLDYVIATIYFDDIYRLILKDGNSSKHRTLLSYLE